ncbi:hypothetical protein KFE25_007288 [Diacronema lutheri]|uniref:Uncharacterized protein n=1 Tax=Diacronema lutheri TaxID=2081491 RepID=A0A8J6CG72_DIALT|nr:hypothetical protein KFE25_007288 [Diacronema lutheri]
MDPGPDPDPITEPTEQPEFTAPSDPSPPIVDSAVKAKAEARRARLLRNLQSGNDKRRALIEAGRAATRPIALPEPPVQSAERLAGEDFVWVMLPRRVAGEVAAPQRYYMPPPVVRHVPNIRGRTSLSTALLCQASPRVYRGVFEHVHLVIPQASFLSMTNSPFAHHDPRKVHHTFDAPLLAALTPILEQRARARRPENTLLIIDDFAANLKDAELRKHLERFANNRRHLRLSVWLIAQTYRALPLSTRKLLTHAFLFRPSNTSELESIRSELVPIDKRMFEAVFQHVFPPGADPHQFMTLDMSSGHIYNRFARIRFDAPPADQPGGEHDDN